MVVVSVFISSSVGALIGVKAPESSHTPSSTSEWKCTLAERSPPNLWITLTIPVRPSAMPQVFPFARYQPSMARAATVRITITRS